MINQEDYDEFCVPVGFIFKPTDTELLSILETKILEPTSAFRFVPECNSLYDEEPWRFFGEPAESRFQEKKKEIKNCFYVFTTLKMKSSKSKSSFNRMVLGSHGGGGGGTWKGNNVKDVKNDRGVIVGIVRNFTFAPSNKGAPAAAGRWIMDEFSIPEMSKDYVVCKIKSITKVTVENLIGNHQDCAYNIDHHMLISDTPHDDTENVGGGDGGHEYCSYTINHGDHMISSIPSSSSSSSSLPMLPTHHVSFCNGDDDIDEFLSSLSTQQYDLQQADQYDHMAYDVDHMLSDILPTEDINGAEGRESAYTVDYDDHRVSSISLPAASTLPAPATLFNDEKMIPSLPSQQGQHDGHMAYDNAHLFRDILVAEGDKVYEHMSQPPMEYCTDPQQQAGAPSSPLDELLLNFPSTHQVQHDQMKQDLDEHLFRDVPPAADIRGHDDQCEQLPLEPSSFQPENKSSHWDLEAFSAFVASEDVNPLVPSCCFTDLVSSPTSVHGVNFDDLWS